MSGRRVLAGVALVLALLAPGCSLVGGGGGYELTAQFSRAVALYPHSHVKVMGVDVGTVDSVEIDGDVIRVSMTIHDDVPLPTTVRASIAAITLVGERNVVLGPPWTPGLERVKDGDVIPLERTDIPVEPDEALQAFTDLARALDPEAVGKLVSNAADAVDGQGAAFNQALEQASTLTQMLAEQDDQLLEAAANLHRVAGALNTRSEQLGRVIESFSAATEVLAAERDGLSAMLGSLVRLTNAGESLLDAYGGQLPGDIAVLTKLALTFESNIGAIEQLITAFPTIGETVVGAYDAVRELIVLRLSVGHSASVVLNKLLAPLGLSSPCIPLVDAVCPGVGP